MPDEWGALCALSFALFLLAAVGHGMWVVARAVIRALLGRETPPMQPQRRPRCQRCDSPWDPNRDNCPICDWPAPLVQPHAAQRALRSLREQWNDWLRAGVIDGPAHQRLMQLVETETARLASVAAPVLPPIPLAAESPAPLVAEPDMEVAVVAEIIEPDDAAASPFRPSPHVTVTPLPAAVAAPPRRSFSELFLSFMEEKNIRWGELIGGLLIVCCSIALVISFWSAIAERPVLKFIVFNGVNAALFGGAAYTERRWKLPNTSRGLFIIAGLLVPLNFLAMAALSAARATPIPLTIIGEAISVLLFSLLLWMAARSIAPNYSKVLPAAVMLSAVAELLVRHLIDRNGDPVMLLAVGAMPVAAMLGVSGAVWLRSRAWSPVTEAQTHELCRMLGLVAFAGLAAAGLLIYRAGATAATMEQLSPLMALYACGPLAVGLLLWKKLRGTELTGMRIAGTAVAVAGVMLMLLAVTFAWPQPATMLTVLLVEAAVLLVVAHVAEMPAAVLPGSLCASLAYLIAWHRVAGRLAWRLSDARELLSQLLTAPTGTALVGAAAICGAAAVWRHRRGTVEAARYFGVAAGINAAASLALVTWYGFGRAGDPHFATWVYLAYGLAALAAARWVLTRALVWSGAALLLTAIVQGLVYGQPWPLEQPWLISLLIHATTFAALAILARWKAGIVGEAWRETATQAATVTTVVATVLAPVGFLWYATDTVSWQLAWLAVIWLMLAYEWRSADLFAVAQSVATAALLGGVTALLQRQAWYAESPLPVLDPWILQAWGIALAASCMAWIAARAAMLRFDPSLNNCDVQMNHDDLTWSQRLIAFLCTRSPVIEFAAASLAITLLFVVAIYAIVPGVAQELAQRSLAARLASQTAATGVRVVPPLAAFEWIGIPHVHAWSAGAWGLFAVCVAVLLVQLRAQVTRNRLATLLLVLSTACLLFSARFETSVAAASALRWSGAIFLLIASALIWLRVPLVTWLQQFGWRTNEDASPRLAGDAWWAILFGALMPWLCMGGFVGIAAVMQRPAEAYLWQWTVGMLALFATTGIVGLVLQRIEGAGESHLSWRNWAADFGRLMTVLGAMPLIVMVLYVVSLALRGNPVVGPEPGSLFARMGLATSYTGPLAIITLTLIGHALRERSSAFALSAGLVLNVSATAGFLLSPQLAGAKLDAILWVMLAQLNAGVAAGFAILWLALVAWRQHRAKATFAGHDSYRTTQSTMGLVLLAIVFVPAAFKFWWDASYMPVHLQVGSPAGWWSLALAVVAAVWNIRPTLAPRAEGETSAPTSLSAWLLAKPIASTGIVGAALWTLSVMATFSVARSTKDDWFALHTLLVSHVLSAAVMLGLGLAATWKQAVTRSSALRVVPWVMLFAFLVCAVSVRGTIEEADRPGWWWSVASLVATTSVLAVLAAFAERRRFVYFAAVCFNLAATTWWFGPAQQFASTNDVAEISEFVWFNALALALPVVAWLWIERRYIAANQLDRQKRLTFGAHRFLTGVASLLLAGTVALGLFADAVGEPFATAEWLGWSALAVTFVATLACLWDPAVRGGAPALYLLGLVGVAFAVDRFNLPPKWLLFNGAVITAAYAIATSYLWSRRAGWNLLAKRVGIPIDAQRPWNSLGWLVPANCLLIAAVLTLVTGIVLNYDELTLRVLAGKAAWFQVLALVLMSRGATRNPLRYLTLALGVLGGILWGWGWLNPHDGRQLLDRGVIVMAALAAAGVLYGFGLIKWLKSENPWAVAGQKLTPICIAGALVALVAILGGEVAYYLAESAVPIADWGKAVVAVSLVGLAVAALVAAVVPGKDPLGLSERGRQAYVYGAEVLLAATFLHIRICMPELFGERFQKFWPLIVMAIAFLGVGLSEWFRRRQQAVLSQPLERTGALLPMLPVAGFWMLDSGTNYSVLLLVVGSLYAALAVLRKSFGFGILAALAANGGLWYFLHKLDGLGVLEHPQVWLIPPAVCVLVAAYLNRERVSQSQLAQIRYITAMTIYVSSTADIFLNGMEQAPWLPFVLGGLSILGVMAGIFLRVRAFLYLGTTFLCMSLLCMIWYAAHDRHQTWIWYASGIVAGALMIVVFAVVEKKRQEFQHVLERLREWEA